MSNGSSNLNMVALNLLEAQLTLYPANADGSPDTTRPIWSGAPAERLTTRERWIVVETRPTGARHPRKHPLVAQYGLSIGRVWALPLSNLTGFHPDETSYVLDVVWRDEEPSGQRPWHRRTFYGVTIAERDFDSQEIAGGVLDNQEFEAQSFLPDEGFGEVPAVVADAPYVVYWRDRSGAIPLYSYNPVSHAFTAIGPVSGRATIGYTANRLAIAFSGAAGNALATLPEGLAVAGLFQRTPDNSALPRLDFYFGSTRVGSVSVAGLWAREFRDDLAPAAAAGAYALYADNNLVASLSAARVCALDFEQV